MALCGRSVVCHKSGFCPRLLGLSSRKNSTLTTTGHRLRRDQVRIENQLFISARTLAGSGPGESYGRKRYAGEQKAAPFAVAAAALGSLGK